MIVVLAGATGTGKTDLAIMLSEEFKAPIISVDSRQIYRYMDIGTNKVDKALRQKYPHYFIDIIYPDGYYSAYNFMIEARKFIKLEEGKYPFIIMAGGTGLYFDAFMNGLMKAGGKNSEIRKKLKERIKREGKFKLFKELFEIDPIYTKKIHPNNIIRVISGLEIFYTTGRPPSSFRGTEEAWSGKVLKFILYRKREKLYQFLKNRVDEMIKKGLMDEVEFLLKTYGKDIIPLKTIGYKEIVDFFEGKVSKNEAIDLIKKNTCRFAKRQITWFKRWKDALWIETENLINCFKVVKEEIFKNL